MTSDGFGFCVQIRGLLHPWLGLVRMRFGYVRIDWDAKETAVSTPPLQWDKMNRIERDRREGAYVERAASPAAIGFEVACVSN